LGCPAPTHSLLARPPPVHRQDLRGRLADNQREARKVAKALLDVQQRIPQATAELQRLEARRAAAADGSAPLRGELRALEARGAAAAKAAAAKRQLLQTIDAELASLQVRGGGRRVAY
jgi:chromosome segregation ATPase